MSILEKVFKNRKHPKSVPEGDLNVILKTKKVLSQDQKNFIITIVKDGIISGVPYSDIAINIMTSTGIYDMIMINSIDDGVEVIF